MSELNTSRIPGPPTKKWVTFDDLIDDALESGKLSPRKAVSPTSSSSSSLTTRDERSTQQQLSSSSNNEPKLRRSSLSATMLTTSELVAKNRLDFSQSLGLPDSSDDDDKYSSAFATLRSRSSHVGWSNKVLAGSSPFGWSDEVLEYDLASSEEETTARPRRPISLVDDVEMDDDTWMQALKSTTTTTSWEKSPSRSFVRNFP